MKASEREQLIRSLKSRFDKNPDRHPGHAWGQVLARLEGSAAALASLIDDAERRVSLARGAHRFAHEERSLGKAAARLGAVFDDLAQGGQADA